MKRLVVVEDEAIVISGIQAILKRIDSNVILCGCATDGLSGYDLIRQVEPDIVMTDIRMPGMDGLSLIESLRKDLPDTVFIIISAYQEFSYAKKALALGAVDYLDKPITIPKFSRALDNAIQLLDKNYLASETDRQIENVLETIITAIRQEDEDELLERSVELIHLLGEQTPLSRMKKRTYEIVCVITSVFFSDSASGMLSEKHFPSHANLQQLNTKEEVIEYTQTIIERILQKIHARHQSKENMSIALALSYIDTHYQQNIGLQELADAVQLHPSYLCSLFKEKVGISFVKYLTQMRIEKAKQFLLEDMKVNRVYEKVGYHNYRYFCDLFKRNTGMTPGEYKQYALTKREG